MSVKLVWRKDDSTDMCGVDMPSSNYSILKKCSKKMLKKLMGNTWGNKKFPVDRGDFILRKYDVDGEEHPCITSTELSSLQENTRTAGQILKPRVISRGPRTHKSTRRVSKQVSVVFFPADPKQTPVWYVMDDATAKTITTVEPFKQWLCAKINETRTRVKIGSSALLLQRQDRDYNFRTLTDTDHLAQPADLASQFFDSIGNDLYAHEQVPGKRAIEVRMRSYHADYTTATECKVKQIGVPFYIHVEEGATHREVQRMVWHRVKFIAWSVEFWKKRQAEVSQGTVESEYPFELAAEPQTAKEGDRLDVWWENDNIIYSGVVRSCVYDQSGNLSQVELLYDDNDVKTYGGEKNSSCSLQNLMERVHQANCIRAMSPYHLVVGFQGLDVTHTIPYRNKAEYMAGKLRPGNLTSGFAYNDESMYLRPQHCLIVNWYHERNARGVSDGRYSENEILMENRYPGARRPSSAISNSTWTHLKPAPDFPRELKISDLGWAINDLCWALNDFNGVYILQDEQYYGNVRYKLTGKPIYMFRCPNDGFWYVGADSQVTFLKSTSANVSFPTQIKWKRINTKNDRSMRRSIRRSSLSPLTNSSDNPAARWQHYTDRQWLDFDPGLNAKLEWAFRNDKACRFRRISSSGQMFTYACDWARMKQINVQNGKEISVIRRLECALPSQAKSAALPSSAVPSNILSHDAPQPPAPPLLHYCEVCMDEKALPFPVVTTSCTHAPVCCADCVADYIAANVHKTDGIQCPICPQTMKHADVQRLANSSDFAEHDRLVTRRVIQAMPNFRWCLTEGCTQGQLHEGGAAAPIVQCQACGAKSCFTHMCPWHEGLTCADYDRRISENAESERNIQETTKRCPKCDAPIYRTRGCDHMTCSQCHHEFCYLCRTDWHEGMLGRRGAHLHAPTCPRFKKRV